MVVSWRVPCFFFEEQMVYEIGDILINKHQFGHVMMALGNNKIIHAKYRENFHIVNNESHEGGQVSYVDEGATVYRPPWALYAGAPSDAKASLRRVADGIKDSAKYGGYRALRLWAGNKKFGRGAAKRLNKYKARMQAGFRDPSGVSKFVSTVTCAEAIVLCYQMSFTRGDHPFFINLDAAHVMPSSLGKWLTDNGWTMA
jgi:hypothetical protein